MGAVKTDRREFLAVGAMAGLALAAAGVSAKKADEAKPKAQLNLSSQDGVIPGRDLPEKVDKMKRWGFDGFEVWGTDLSKRVDELKKIMSDSGMPISAICAGYQGALVSDQESERKKAVETMKEILTAAGELGSTGLIYVPAFNGQTKLNNREARKILLDLLPELGSFAHAAGTRVLLEPLNRGEAFFVRQLADAAAICRDANSTGACMMGDMYHMHIEETSDTGAFLSAGPYLHHVHIASIKRNLPGQDERDFRPGFKGLKMIGYHDFCSLECGVIGDRETEIPKAVKFLRRQWAEA